MMDFRLIPLFVVFALGAPAAQANTASIIQSYATGIDFCRTVALTRDDGVIAVLPSTPLPETDQEMRGFDLDGGVVAILPVDAVVPCSVTMPVAPDVATNRAISDWARVHFTEQVTLYGATGFFANPTREDQFNVFWCPEDGGPLQYLHIPGTETRAPGLAAHIILPPEGCPAEETS